MSIGDNRLPALADDIRKLHRSIDVTPRRSRMTRRGRHDGQSAASAPALIRSSNRVPQACDERDLEVWRRLLAMLAMVIVGRRHQPAAPDRHDQESLVAAYERLWDLRHPDTAEGSTSRCSAPMGPPRWS